MEPKIFYIILSIIGFFGVVALSVNAYFMRGMIESLNQVKIQTAVLIEKSESKETRLAKLERESEALRKRYHDLLNKLIELGSRTNATE